MVRFLIFGTIVLFGLGVVLGVVAVQANNAADNAEAALKDAKSAIKAVEKNQIVTCQSGNETRLGQREAWDFVLDVSNDGGAEETYILEKMRTWFHDVFANRDCASLDEKVEIPPRPNLKKLLKEAREQ